jgi:hypothetical protein
LCGVESPVCVKLEGVNVDPRWRCWRECLVKRRAHSLTHRCGRSRDVSESETTCICVLARPSFLLLLNVHRDMPLAQLTNARSLAPTAMFKFAIYAGSTAGSFSAVHCHCDVSKSKRTSRPNRTTPENPVFVLTSDDIRISSHRFRYTHIRTCPPDGRSRLTRPRARRSKRSKSSLSFGVPVPVPGSSATPRPPTSSQEHVSGTIIARGT